MKTFAVVEAGIVTNIIVGVEPEVVEANPDLYIEYTAANPACIGLSYDSATGIFEQPAPAGA